MDEIRELLRTILAQLSEADETSSKKEGEMVREIPLEVEPLSTEGESDEVEDEEESEEAKEKETVKRINEVVNAVKDMKNVLKDFLWLAYRMKLTDDELKELTNKVLDLISSYVTDITTERIRNFSGEELEVKEKK